MTTTTENEYEYEYELPEDFEPITLQKIFDLAWEHFILNDNPPAVEEGVGCRYLTSDGRKCAVGLAIPDGHPAQHSIDTFAQLVDNYPELFDLSIRKKGTQLSYSDTALNQFQRRLHDQLQEKAEYGEWDYTKEEREREYRQVAKEYGLTVPNSPERRKS